MMAARMKMRLLSIKILMISLLLASIVNAHEVKEIILPVVSVYDGDTFETRLTLPEPINAVSIRIKGIDTPEMPALSYATTGKLGRAKCVKEAELALKAKANLIKIIENGKYSVIVRNMEWDPYGGRIDAEAFVNINGIITSIPQKQIEDGFAVSYDGSTTTSANHNWCL